MCIRDSSDTQPNLLNILGDFNFVFAERHLKSTLLKAHDADGLTVLHFVVSDLEEVLAELVITVEQAAEFFKVPVWIGQALSLIHISLRCR